MENTHISAGSSPKKRVLFVVTQSELGGAQRFLHTLVTRLDKNRYDILIAAGPNFGCKYELLDLLEKEGIKTLRLKHLKREINPFYDIRAVLELKRTLGEFKPDTLFLLSSKAGFLGSLAAKFMIHNSSFKVIYRIGGWTFNDPWPKWKKWLWIELERFSSGWKDYIIVNNKHDLEQARNLKIKPKEKVLVVYNGLDVYKMELLPKEEARLKLYEKAASQSGLPTHTGRVFQDKKIIGAIANFYSSKGLKYLIETAEYFKNKDDIIFIIIGDGQERNELERLIKQRDLPEKVLLLGRIPDAYKLLNAFDIFVLPSVKEGFPWAIIEAMAAKLPVVATNVGAVPEIIEDGRNGFVVKPGRPEKIAEKIQDLLNDDRLRQEFGIQAHQTVLFKFELDKMIKCIEELL